MPRMARLAGSGTSANGAERNTPDAELKETPVGKVRFNDAVLEKSVLLVTCSGEPSRRVGARIVLGLLTAPAIDCPESIDIDVIGGGCEGCPWSQKPCARG